DEATELTVDDWEAITSRLRHGRLSFQQLLAACNPDAPTHWLKQRCDKGLTRLINTRHEDNPVYYNPDGTLTERGRDYIGKLDRLTGVRHARLRRGVCSPHSSGCGTPGYAEECGLPPRAWCTPT